MASGIKVIIEYKDGVPFKACTTAGCNDGEVQALDKFGKHAAGTGGRKARCKACDRAYDRKRNGTQARVDSSRRNDAKRKANGKAAIQQAAINLKRKDDPAREIMQAAGRAARAAHKNDGPIKESCEQCGDEAHYRHHWSYAEARWTDIIWLCRKCHSAEHKAIDTLGREKGITGIFEKLAAYYPDGRDTHSGSWYDPTVAIEAMLVGENWIDTDNDGFEM